MRLSRARRKTLAECSADGLNKKRLLSISLRKSAFRWKDGSLFNVSVNPGSKSSLITFGCVSLILKGITSGAWDLIGPRGSRLDGSRDVELLPVTEDGSWGKAWSWGEQGWLKMICPCFTFLLQSSVLAGVFSVTLAMFLFIDRFCVSVCDVYMFTWACLSACRLVCVEVRGQLCDYSSLYFLRRSLT